MRKARSEIVLLASSEHSHRMNDRKREAQDVVVDRSNVDLSQ
jgi:hypothetical protein